ncbi:hypothetical protein PORY_000676 [Pneumocystis oryctolagi]|uniref:Uncharacterized protein n=1 Tax=Pneumocystis oryctolagi TaxID=42067 RepID=A0ACB7CDN8_9ASCO|nr:hypothetical protein PORY_000676 [Pneumocystis oryctolagi]
MSTRARAEKGRFIAGSTEFDIVPQKWRQEWVTRQISTKDGKTDSNISFKTFCWVPVKEPETPEKPLESTLENGSTSSTIAAGLTESAVLEN